MCMCTASFKCEVGIGNAIAHGYVTNLAYFASLYLLVCWKASRSSVCFRPKKKDPTHFLIQKFNTGDRGAD